MRKIISVAHISLDGFVAGVKGELDGFEAGEENLQFVCSLTEQADAALFGRVSYEMLNSHWPNAKNRPNATKGEISYSNWYNAAQKIIFSRTMHSAGLDNTIVINENSLAEITALKKQPGKDILIFGSPATTQSLMQLNLVDSYWIFVNPVIFGKGIPLFKDLKDRIKLRLMETKQLVNGEIALHYSRTE